MRIRSASSWWLWVGIVASAVSVSACATRSVQRVVHAESGVVVSLRHQTRDGIAVDRGFQQPIEISPARLEAILSMILVRDRKTGVKPAVPNALVRKISAGLAHALAEATAAEEVALTAIRRTRRLGVFTEKYLTSFVAYVEDDQLLISFSYSDGDLSLARTAKTKSDRLPQPHLGDHVMDFTVIPGDGFEVVGPQMVKVPLTEPAPEIEPSPSPL